MECDFDGCKKMSCASTSAWLKTGGLHIKYWCKKHAPQDDPNLDWHCWANVMTVGCCPACELESAQHHAHLTRAGGGNEADELQPPAQVA